MNLTDLKRTFSDLKRRLFVQLIFTGLLLMGLILIARWSGHLSPAVLDYMTTLHHVLIFFSSLLSWSIFILAYFSYPQVRDPSLLISGFTFFTAGILDGIILLSTLVSAVFGDRAKSQPLLIGFISQLFVAIGLSITILYKKRLGRAIRGFYPLLMAILASLSGSIISVLFPLENVIFIQERGLTLVGTVLVMAFILTHAALLCCLVKWHRRTGDNLYKILSWAFLLMAFSQMALLSITYTYDFSHLLSLIFQLFSYALFFYVFYVQSVKRPYHLLSSAQDQLNGYLAELDILVDKRTTELRNMNEKLVADQEIARSMQMSMLPSTLPHNEYVSFSSGYVPAEKLSGDFYNVFIIDDAQFGICIGDVSGHGVSAAMLSIFTFQKMQSLMEETGGDGMAIPSMVLKHIYESFNSGNFNEDMYIVMLYGVFNTQTGIFSYASGGLNTTPLRIRPDGSIQELDNDGFAICKLGDLLKPKFVNHQVLLFPGDKLVLYTDGLVDARNPSDESYSLQRLKTTIRHHYKWGVEHLTDSLIKDVQSFTQNKAADDITVVAFDVLPPF